MADVGNWTVEQCSTTGTGDLVLIGSDLGLTRFRDSLPTGDVYYSIQDGTNRETGIGTFNGTSTISRDTVTSTLVNSVYDDSSPTAITLSGSSIVSCSFSKGAFDMLVAAIAANVADIATNTSDIADNVTAIALKAATTYVDAADLLAVLLDGSRNVTGVLKVKPVISSVAAIIVQPSGSGGTATYYLTDHTGIVRGKLEFFDITGDITLKRYNSSGVLETNLTIDSDGVTSDGKVNGATVHATNGTSGTFTSVTVVDGIVTAGT